MNMHRSQPKLYLTVKQLSIHVSAKRDPETNLRNWVIGYVVGHARWTDGERGTTDASIVTQEAQATRMPYKGLYADFECKIRTQISGEQWEMNWNKLSWSLLGSFLCVSVKFQAILVSFAPVSREGLIPARGRKLRSKTLKSRTYTAQKHINTTDKLRLCYFSIWCIIKEIKHASACYVEI